MGERDVEQTRQPTEKSGETDNAKSSERPSLTSDDRQERNQRNDQASGSTRDGQDRPSLPNTQDHRTDGGSPNTRSDIDTVHRDHAPSKDSASTSDHHAATQKDANKHTVTDHHNSKGEKTGSTETWREKASDGTFHDHTKETVGNKTVAHSETWQDRNGNTHVKTDHFENGVRDRSTESWKEKGADGTQHERSITRDAHDNKLYGNDRWRDENGNEHSRIDNYDDKGKFAGSTERWQEHGADGRTDTFSDHRDVNGERTFTHGWSTKEGPVEFTKHYDKDDKLTSTDMKWQTTKPDGTTTVHTEHWDRNGTTKTDVSRAPDGLKSTHVEQFDRNNNPTRTEDRQEVVKDGRIQETVTTKTTTTR
ncbi:hypothetical protein [Herbidospora sp. NBRC 101105]|uniref:hypothetical protein n=1 Tax=Herbidospora sp. NBRC 101105 TaxID=3032195 RepID=UPI0024A317F6|nr:hypothetical protein [Herbidospora sp. NBRC 101105]GLX97338.1 hypothetical protein Hesp01_52880 [Herbidospora sp. NBRC 101105]